MAEQNYSAVDFNVLPSASDGKTLLYAEGQVCKSEKDLGELIGEETSGKLDISAFNNASGNFALSADVYNKTEIDEKLENFGGFEVVPLTTGENPVPDVADPSTKIIYLTKEEGSTKTDPYTEWIYTSAWEIIGETTVDLTNYYKNTETSGANEISDALTKKENKLTAGTNLTFIEVSNEIKSAKITHIKEMDGSEITEDFSFPGYWISYPDPSTMTCTCELKIEFKHQLDYYTNIILTLTDKQSETGQDKTVELKTLSVDDNIFSAPQDKPNFTINVKEIGTDFITFNGITIPYPILLLKSLTTSPADTVKIIKTNDNNCVSDSELNNFAVGIETSAINSDAAFAEGYKTLASGFASHAEGYKSSAVEEAAHAEGSNTLASGRWSHTEGQRTSANADYSHAEGYITIASGSCSHAEGYQTSALYDYTHSEGNTTKANNVGAHAEGQNTSANGYFSHAEGGYTLTTDNYSHAEGYNTIASGNYSHAEGYNTTAGIYSHSEGNQTSAVNEASHAEGYYTSAGGSYSHTEGQSTSANGAASHAEGQSTYAVGECSHSEGSGTSAIGYYSHAEGQETSAVGDYGSHAEGYYTSAKGEASHAEGYYTIAGDNYMHAAGKYNYTSSNAAFVIGKGTGVSTRSDAFVVDWTGVASAVNMKTSAGQVIATNSPTTDGYVLTYDGTNNSAVWAQAPTPTTEILSAGSGIVFREDQQTNTTYIDADTANYKLITNTEYNTLTAKVNQLETLLTTYSGLWVLTNTPQNNG